MQTVLDEIVYQRIRSIYPSHNNIWALQPKNIKNAGLAMKLYEEFPHDDKKHYDAYLHIILRSDISYFNFHDTSKPVTNLYETLNIARMCPPNIDHIQFLLDTIIPIEQSSYVLHFIKCSLKQIFLNEIFVREDIQLSDKLIIYEKNKPYAQHFCKFVSHNAKPTDVLCHTEINWYYSTVIRSPYINMDFVKNHIPIDQPYVVQALSSSVKSIQDIENNPDIPWEYNKFIHNKNIPFEYIMIHIDKVKPARNLLFAKYVDEYGCSGELQFQKFLEWISPHSSYIEAYSPADDFIRMRLRAFDVENLLSILPNISIDEWEYFLVNSLTITYDKFITFVKPLLPKEIDEYRCNLSSRLFELNEDEICNNIKRYIAANRIQRAWKRCISNPDFTICCLRLKREFTNLTNE